ncbi:MAG: amino acid--tRNA ligase-related protein [Chloroflexota bacterium]
MFAASRTLSLQDERWLGEWARAEIGSDFLFAYRHPMVSGCHTHPDPSDRYSNSFDLLFRDRTGYRWSVDIYEDHPAALSRAGYPRDPFETYLEAFRYGMPPHGGFAIGLERLLMQLLGLSNLRLAISGYSRVDLTRLSP